MSTCLESSEARARADPPGPSTSSVGKYERRTSRPKHRWRLIAPSPAHPLAASRDRWQHACETEKLHQLPVGLGVGHQRQASARLYAIYLESCIKRESCP
eukprot:4416538-Prymnesium_polylepis.4